MMEAVQSFSDELNSLYEVKPPVSKAKMGMITKAAMKGVKYYKHIVQIVEKFVARCRPEYKIPGLYVIDSIVRQSRHQFGPERDVYASRFSRNLQLTFDCLFTGCSQEDKPKIVRVLNLWQKNGVFSAQIIQPLLDMANPNSAQTSEQSKSDESSKYSSQQYRSLEAASNGPLRFSKNMLDFDYDEDDDEGDETPTEAEPPLSSTLNKLEMEHRGTSKSNRISNSPMAPAKQQIHQREDPVLERWNKIIKQQSVLGDDYVENHCSEPSRASVRQRSRSRSPIARAMTPPKPKSPAAQNSIESSEERKAERARKCLPPIREKHLTVCSSTLWLGHVPKSVTEADISDAFGEYGTINSIDLIPPRGCAYISMDRRQDAKRALKESRHLKLNGSHIKMAWAPGKGFKEYRVFKDYWEVDVGASFIPYAKIDSSIDFDKLEEGGVIDEDSMSMQMRENRDRKNKRLVEPDNKNDSQSASSVPLPTLPILSRPPPSFAVPPPNLSIPPPNMLGHNPGSAGIPFPPPISVTSSTNTMLTSSSASLVNNPRPHESGKLSENQNNEMDKLDQEVNMNSPSTIDRQLNVTEQQISMVEQQLNMIQQAKGMGTTQTSMSSQMPTFPNPAVFQQNQPNPMIFDMSAALLQGTMPHMLDPHLQQQFNPFYANPNPMLLGQPPPLLPVSQANMNQSFNEDASSQFANDRYLSNQNHQ